MNDSTPALRIELARLNELRRAWSDIYAETYGLSSEARRGVELTGADIRLRMEQIDAELNRRDRGVFTVDNTPDAMTAIHDLHDAPSVMAS